jgi:Cu/Ag efflux protein CusF
MKTLSVCTFTCLVIASPLLQAQPTASSSQVMTAPGSAKLVETARTTATIVGIAPATRTVSLKRADGQIVDIQVGEEVRNFDRIKVGNAVNIEYTRALSLNLKKGGAGSPKQSESAHVTRAPAGGQPGATVGQQVSITADVVAVDTKDQVVTLRGPQGHLVELKVRDPNQLKRVKKGDQVEAVYTEAVAVAVEPASASSPK